MVLDNYRILKIDSFNYVFEEYREFVSPKDKQVKKDWMRCNGYFGSVERCLDALKSYIVGKIVNETDEYDEVLRKIDNLRNAIVSCSISSKYVEIKE